MARTCYFACVRSLTFAPAKRATYCSRQVSLVRDTSLQSNMNHVARSCAQGFLSARRRNRRRGRIRYKINSRSPESVMDMSGWSYVDDPLSAAWRSSVQRDLEGANSDLRIVFHLFVQTLLLCGTICVSTTSSLECFSLSFPIVTAWSCWLQADFQIWVTLRAIRSSRCHVPSGTMRGKIAHSCNREGAHCRCPGTCS